MTYELFAWYAPLLMIDLMMKMSIVGIYEDLSIFDDDDGGWMGGN